MTKKEEKEIENDDIVIESEEEDTKKSSFSKDDNKIKTLLKECELQKKEYLDGWQRSQADMVNLKKDLEKQRSDFQKYAKVDFISQIIPVLDSFDMAFSNTDGVPEGWLSGVKYIYDQFVSILADNGVKQFNPDGEQFDHNRHTSIETKEIDESSKDGIILKVLQKGYEMDGKVLREAKVVVGKIKE